MTALPVLEYAAMDLTFLDSDWSIVYEHSLVRLLYYHDLFVASYHSKAPSERFGALLEAASGK